MDHIEFKHPLLVSFEGEKERKEERQTWGFRFKEEDDEDDVITSPNDDGQLLTTLVIGLVH